MSRKSKNVMVAGIIVPILMMSGNAPDMPFAPELVAVPAGSYEMGQVLPSGLSLGAPVHKVTITRDFEMGKFEVTNEQFCRMLNYAKRKGYLAGDYRGNVSVMNKEGDRQELLDLNANRKGIKCEISFKGRRFVVEKGKEKRPVVYVTWYGAAFFCNMLSEQDGLIALYDLNSWTCKTFGNAGYRLPTEAEWEYAARYDDGRALAWGNAFAMGTMNFGLNTGHATDVGSFPEGKSKLGMYDITGNVEEWIHDWYGAYATEDVVDPTGIEDGVYKEKRGGSWYKDDNNFPYLAYRYDTNYAYTSYFDIGFRVVKIPADG